MTETNPTTTATSPTATSASSFPEPQPTVGAAIGRVLRQPPFLVVVIIMVAAALGLNAAVGYLQLHFKKEPVPLAKELSTIPDHLGSWVQVSQDKTLDKELQDVLGTDRYIFRDYIDESVIGAGASDKYKDQSDDKRKDLLAQDRAKYPRAVISLSVTYYTGMVDTVAHVPDRCVTADGYEPKSYETPAWPIARDLPMSSKKRGDDNISVRYINFEDQNSPSNNATPITRSICYFFQANGDYVSSPLDVRQKLANLMERKGYYAKIECMTTVDDPKVAAKVMTDFLIGALPEIHKCMPDWEKVHGGGGGGMKPQQVAAK
jgi:hypothetical protein